MTTKGKILIVFFTLLIGEFGTTVIAYNPLLTYIIRIRNFKFFPNIYGNFTYNNYKTTDEYINVNFSIKIPSNMMNKDIDVIAIIDRCDPEGIICNHFDTWKLDLCRILSQKNQLWSNIVSAIHPNPKCPLKEYYQLINASVEIGPIINLYPEATEHHWKILAKYQVNNFFLGGFKLDASVFGYRKRNKKLLLI